MHPAMFTEREFYRRRPVVSEMPVTLALLLGAAVAVLVGTPPVLDAIETTGVGFVPLISVPLLVVASQLCYGVGLGAVAFGYSHARGIDLPTGRPTRADLRPLAVGVLGPPATVALIAAVTPLFGSATFADVAGSWYAPGVSLGWVVRSSLPRAVFVSVGVATLYHGAVQGTFRSVTDGDAAVATTGLVALFVFATGDPVFFVGSVGSVAGTVGLGVTVTVVGIAAWAYDRAATLALPALAYASYLLAIEVAAFLTAGPQP